MKPMTQPIPSPHPRPFPRHGRAKVALLVVLGLVLAGIVVWFWARSSTQPSLNAGKSVAEAFLKLLQEKQEAAAWESTTAEFKSAQGRESFVKEVQSRKLFEHPWEFVSVQTVMVNEQPRAEYLFRNAENQTTRLLIASEGGVWKVDRWID